MSEEKKCTKTEECCEGKKELTQEELEKVTGGSDSDDHGIDNPLLVSDYSRKTRTM